MKQIVSPIFQSFLVLLHTNQIDGWTSQKIWNNLNLSKDEKQRINQQQLYRLLRKLVRQSYLVKNIHPDNPRLSTFVETKSMATFRKQFELQTVKNDSGKLEFKTKKLKEKQKIYENQIKASEQALIDFPELKTDILKRKNQLLQDIEKLKAYTDFLTSLI
jgi:DNA-binding PadR family transcriptional regulator